MKPLADRFARLPKSDVARAVRDAAAEIPAASGGCKPRPRQEMLVACLWSRWRGSADEPALLSFAAIPDDPPPEVAAAGHNRCIVPGKAHHIDAWLDPDRHQLHRQQAILDDRERPYDEHCWLEAA
jgi:hypothetical protein